MNSFRLALTEIVSTLMVLNPIKIVLVGSLAKDPNGPIHDIESWIEYARLSQRPRASNR